MAAANDCESQLLDVLGRIVRRLTRLSGGLDEGPALTATQRVALIETLEAAEPIRLHDLAERLGVTAPTASRAVDGLVEHGVLERRPDPDDRRAVRISLTSEGRSLVEERKSRVLAAFLPAAAAMAPTDQERLIELLAELDRALTALQ
ncbi:MAG TPA: MarR family transcriptional regulator [Gaiellaceae bacterium]|nr:MarR family transcriptional regulator [Gaiellaceae bacterium]